MPDILYHHTTSERTKVKHTYLDGPADLAVEIMSPDSVKRDREEKFREYSKAGVREYWLIDPMRQEATFFELTSRRSTIEPIAVKDGLFRSRAVSGFYLRIAWLWEIPLTMDALRELGLFVAQ